MTVTPEIVRVVFLRRIGRSRFLSDSESVATNSELDGIAFRLYFAAIRIFSRARSSLVGFFARVKFSMMSLNASLEVNEPTSMLK